MENCSSHIFITIPCLSKTIMTDISFSEKVSDLISRVLLELGIKEFSNFQLFGKKINLQAIPNDSLCYTLFASPYDSFLLQNIDFTIVKIYFENKVAKIEYNPIAQLSELISIAVNCLSIDIGVDYFLAIDAKTSNILPYDQPIKDTDSIILMPFFVFLPGILFTPNTFPSQKENTFLVFQCLSSVFFSKSFRNILDLLNSRSNTPFHISKLTKKKTKEIFSLYMGEKDMSRISPDDLNSFAFMLLSSSEKPLMGDRLHKLSIEAIERETDIERIEFITVITSYMPICTYFILLELSQIYGGILSNERTRREVICILTDLLFPKSINQMSEMKFVSYLLMFYSIVFCVPPKANNIIRIKDDTIYLAEKTEKEYKIYSIYGPENITFEETEELKMNSQLSELLDKYCDKEDYDNIETVDILDEFDTFNKKIQNLSNLFSEFKDIGKRINLYTRRKSDASNDVQLNADRLRKKRIHGDKMRNRQSMNPKHFRSHFVANEIGFDQNVNLEKSHRSKERRHRGNEGKTRKHVRFSDAVEGYETSKSEDLNESDKKLLVFNDNDSAKSEADKYDQVAMNILQNDTVSISEETKSIFDNEQMKENEIEIINDENDEKEENENDNTNDIKSSKNDSEKNEIETINDEKEENDKTKDISSSTNDNEKEIDSINDENDEKTNGKEKNDKSSENDETNEMQNKSDKNIQTSESENTFNEKEENEITTINDENNEKLIEINNNKENENNETNENEITIINDENYEEPKTKENEFANDEDIKSNENEEIKENEIINNESDEESENDNIDNSDNENNKEIAKEGDEENEVVQTKENKTSENENAEEEQITENIEQSDEEIKSNENEEAENENSENTNDKEISENANTEETESENINNKEIEEDDKEVKSTENVNTEETESENINNKEIEEDEDIEQNEKEVKSTENVNENVNTEETESENSEETMTEITDESEFSDSESLGD
ncbi:hypothetical protein GPJ56_009608 [Histomonas meleagridis]|uniref:uncharacterized protein n=1 Tax=Histomonas meleagridis TaxID=135588 RepID=UPI00355984F7|nr:hypothetical protein GPJ56_009608 [Histomonas meleagridis]KAH0799625.1 hypothetical protein GO595_007539 [Histomonas meleagridis]